MMNVIACVTCSKTTTSADRFVSETDGAMVEVDNDIDRDEQCTADRRYLSDPRGTYVRRLRVVLGDSSAISSSSLIDSQPVLPKLLGRLIDCTTYISESSHTPDTRSDHCLSPIRSCIQTPSRPDERCRDIRIVHRYVLTHALALSPCMRPMYVVDLWSCI